MSSTVRSVAPSCPPARFRGAAGLLLVPAVLGLALARPPGLGRAAVRFGFALSGARQVPVAGLLLQRGVADCGPTALHNLLTALGVPSPGPSTLARLSGTGPTGVSLGGLVRAADAAGVALRARRVSAAGLVGLRAPFLAWMKPHHFVTVLALGPGGNLVLHDPGAGAYRISLQAFRRRWGGVVADLAPGGATSAGSRPVLFLPASSFDPGTRAPSDGRIP